MRKATQIQADISIYPTSLQDATQSRFFKWCSTGLNLEFSFTEISFHTEVKEPSLTIYLPITEERIVGFIPFARVLVLSEIQTTLFRIRTPFVVSISNDLIQTGICTLIFMRLHIDILFFSENFFKSEHISEQNGHMFTLDCCQTSEIEMMTGQPVTKRDYIPFECQKNVTLHLKKKVGWHNLYTNELLNGE